MPSVQDLVKQYAATNTSNSSSSSNSSAASSASSSNSGSASGSIFNSSTYADSTNISAQDALQNLINNQNLFGSAVTAYQSRMICGVEQMINNEDWRVSMDSDGDGEQESLKLVDAIAASFDSELDLYIQNKVDEVIDKYGCSSLVGYLTEDALKELASFGIRVDSVGDLEQMTNRTYTFTLVDVPDDIAAQGADAIHNWLYNTEEGQNAKAIEDANHKKGSYIFSDCLIPDGCAQGAEVNLSSILDQMGYDCISKADFIGREDEYFQLLNSIDADRQSGWSSGMFTVGDESINDLYGYVKDIRQSVKDLWGGSGAAPGVYGTGAGEVSKASELEGLTEAEKAEMEEKEKEMEEIKDYINSRTEYYTKQFEKEGKDASAIEITRKVDQDVIAKYGSQALADIEEVDV